MNIIISKKIVLHLASILICTLFGIAPTFGTIPKVDYQIDISSGLTHNGVTSMIRDSKGYIWIGTYDGLSQYNDGKVVTFKNEPDNRPFLSNRVRSLIEDSNGNIWIGTEFGVSVFSYEDYQFKNLPKPSKFTHDAEFIIRQMILMGDKMVCICESEGVVIYNADHDIVDYTPAPYSYSCHSATALDEDNILLAAQQGLYIYNIKSHSYKAVDIGADIYTRIMTAADDNTILLAMDTGVVQFTYERDQRGEYSFRQIGRLYYPEHTITSLSIDDDGSLWLGSFADGLCYIDNYKEHMGRPMTRLIEHFRISCTLLDSPNTKWVATFDGGVFSLSKRRAYIKDLSAHPSNLRYLRMPQIANYLDKHLIVQSANNTIVSFDSKTLELEDLPFDLPKEYSNTPKYLFSNGTDDIWLFCVGVGNIWFHIKNGECFEYKVDKITPSSPTDIPKAVDIDKYGNLWVGYNNALYRVRMDGDEITSIESIERHSRFSGSPIEKVRTIYADHQSDYIWVGTDAQGFYVINAEPHRPLHSAKVMNYTHNINDATTIPSNFITCFMRDSKGEMWIGTEQGGLCRAIASTASDIDALQFTRYDQSDGLNNGVVKSLLCDSLGRVWVGTNVGLYLYQPDQNHFLGYHIMDGLPFEDFWYCTATFDDGLFFTASNGIMGFNVNDFPQNDVMPKVEFSSVRIFNNEYIPFDKRGDRVVLSLSEEEGNHLSLNYDENLLSINLDMLYSEQSSNHRISYQLMPTSSRWITLPDEERSISISGLSPGKHTLKVRVSDAMNNWTDAQYLEIEIKPPFWATPWAILAYIIAAISILVGAFKLVTHTQSLRHRLAMVDIERKNIERINEEKQRYFADIAHELKTPLTLLYAPLESLYRQFKVDAEVRQKLLIIKRQSKKILSLVELAHISRLNEMNLLKLERAIFNFKGFINNITSDVQFFAEYEQKNFEVRHPQNGAHIYLDADRDMIEKVMNNLLSNAFKYTKVDDTIYIEYYTDSSNIIIKVCDSGYGITAEDLPHIFERYYHGDKKRINVGGTGIGLAFTKRLVEMHNGTIEVESRPSEGSTFTVTLPALTKAQTAGQTTIEEEDLADYETIEEQEQEQSQHIDIIGDDDLMPVNVDSPVAGSVIFVVEDNYELMLLMSQSLSRSFTVETFSNGAECIDRLATRWPDLIISDVMMPEMDGLELCQRIKGDIKTSHIPVILLTARATVDDKIKGLEYGADAYIFKPFYPKYLFKRIEALLKSRILLRNKYQIGAPVPTSETTNSSRDNEFLERLFELFSENLDNEDLDVYSLAAELGLNRSFFLQKIKSTTNYSPYELLKDYKLKRAAELLNGNEYNVNEVCTMTGFKSRTHFSRLFKERYGVSPSRFARGDEGKCDGKCNGQCDGKCDGKCDGNCDNKNCPYAKNTEV